MKAHEVSTRHEPGWEELEPRIFRQARPGLQPVLERAFALLREDAKLVVAGDESAGAVRKADLEHLARRTKLVADVRARAMAPEDAWLRLVPKAWLVDDRRWLVGDRIPRGTPCEEPTLSVPWTSFLLTREPSSLDYLTTLTSDPANVEAAEEHAREACRRMTAWKWPEPARVVWLAEEHVRLFDFIGARPFRARADERLGLEVEPSPPDPGRAESAAVQWRRETQLFAKRDLMRANAWTKSGDTMPNPFEPIVAIYRLGYALVGVLDGGIVLAAAAPKLDDLLDPLARARG